KNPDLFHACSHNPLGGFAPKNQGASPTRNANLFFFTSRGNLTKDSRHLEHRCSNPDQAIPSKFWQSPNLLGNLIPLFPKELVDNGREEDCSLFETFSSQFLEKMLKGGFLTKRGITKLPRIKRFAFAT